MILPALFFYLFAGVCVASAVMVIVSRNPVHSVLFLILAFVNASGLFVLMGQETGVSQMVLSRSAFGRRGAYLPAAMQGLLAVRQSIAAKVNITYKILFNDAVAMTGGQPVDGTMKVPEMTRELDAEGATRIVVVTDEPEKYEDTGIAARLAKGVTVHHRDELDQRGLAGR